jgi:hypothetical protein
MRATAPGLADSNARLRIRLASRGSEGFRNASPLGRAAPRDSVDGDGEPFERLATTWIVAVGDRTREVLRSASKCRGRALPSQEVRYCKH